MLLPCSENQHHRFVSHLGFAYLEMESSPFPDETVRDPPLGTGVMSSVNEQYIISFDYERSVIGMYDGQFFHCKSCLWICFVLFNGQKEPVRRTTGVI